ncbi:flavin reductase [Adhaeribacter aerolatus]|uniref:Flavin reductase n=1 Tax=Adhaeribacter aerolatus TaxID=670289 RepID=A0A512AWP2_9BACT|nr:flavin reductase family protein [Adhaeribacter aerolatus]GEO04135.1 flavin reductase [Adhaeribacter aerolatus]
MFKSFDAKALSPAQLQNWLQSAIAPRPIAFASTQDAAGNINLSPFSFFNVFGTNPPIIIFSPARRIRDNTTKHTLQNVQQVPEVVIHIGNYPLVEQMSLASTEYPAGVNEFIKAGLTPIPAVLVKPPRVQEAPVAFECRVMEVKSIGDQNGAANLVICEVLMLHIHEAILNTAGTAIDPLKLQPVARLGGDWYGQSTAESLFRLPKPNNNLGMGFDQLPPGIRQNIFLDSSNLARLANLEKLPTYFELQNIRQEPYVQYLLQKYAPDPAAQYTAMSKLAKKLILLNQPEKALQILLTLL